MPYMRQAITYLPDPDYSELVELAKLNRWSVSATLAWIVEEFLRAERVRDEQGERT